MYHILGKQAWYMQRLYPLLHVLSILCCAWWEVCVCMCMCVVCVCVCVGGERGEVKLKLQNMVGIYLAQ